jgi:hypothetical protein
MTHKNFCEVLIRELIIHSHEENVRARGITRGRQNLFLGEFSPSRLRYAIIRPLFKEGNKNDLSNYRPLLILSSFSKIVENVMHNQAFEASD